MVLGYIQNESRRFYVYVANRIQIIRSISDPSQWKYVDTSVNPADSAARCRPFKQLIMSSWFDSPNFLRHPPSPLVSCPEIDVTTNDPEVRPETSALSSDIQEMIGQGSGIQNGQG